MKRLSIATEGRGQLTSNVTYFADSWFSSVKIDEEEMAAVFDVFGMAKTIHKGFCLSTIKKLTKDWPGGSYIVMKSNPIVPGAITLLSIGCK